MTHTPELLRVIEQNELDKTLKCVRLVDSNGVFALVVDEKYGGLVAAAPDMLRALEEVMDELDVEGLPCPLCGRDLTIGHRHNCIWHVVEAAVRKARGKE